MSPLGLGLVNNLILCLHCTGTINFTLKPRVMASKTSER